MVATDASTGRVIGYASLILAPGESRRTAWHDMTAVLRAWRGRGVAGMRGPLFDGIMDRP